MNYPNGVLISQGQIAGKVKELAEAISGDYANLNPILVGILKGSFVFMSDLIRHLDIPFETDFLAVSSYDGKQSSGVVGLRLDLATDIQNRHVLLVEDIVDSGLTLSYLYKILKVRNPLSLKVVSLLLKSDSYIADIPIDYIGFYIPSVFVVGYGMDFNERYRGLADIRIYNESDRNDNRDG